MSRPTSIVCDECGAQKKEINHWWVLCHGQSTVRIWPFAMAFETTHESEKSGESVKDLCSEQCVTRAIGKWMRGELK